MDILFLGTGAADWPNPGKHANGGRRYSSLLLNRQILIDCGPMTLDAIEEFGVNPDAITDIVISHPHGDHFDFPSIEKLALKRSSGITPLRLHVNTKATERAVPKASNGRLEVAGYRPGEQFTCACATVQSLPANHRLEIPGELAAHLIVKTDAGENLLYLLDGAWLPSESWGLLRSYKQSMDYVIWELTCGDTFDWRLFEHCNLTMIKSEREIWKNYGVVRPDTVSFCSHLARTLCPPQEIYATRLAVEGFILAYDGYHYQHN